ncbi:MAG: hypothetical protein ACI80E_000963, partial [Oceanospirillaceae bacterium]
CTPSSLYLAFVLISLHGSLRSPEVNNNKSTKI